MTDICKKATLFIPSSFAFWILALEKKHMLLEFGRVTLISKLVE
ncbi:hypothetical protein V6Z12_A10G268000 [Gossypium hirsutum]